jgi:hypothetical protein
MLKVAGLVSITWFGKVELCGSIRIVAANTGPAIASKAIAASDMNNIFFMFSVLRLLQVAVVGGLINLTGV